MGNNNGTSWENVGCIALIALFALPYILQSLLVAIMPYILLGAIGLGIYRVYIYDTKTGAITEWLEETFGLPNSKKKREENDTQGLAPPQEDLLIEIKALKELITKIQNEIEQIKVNRKKDIQDTLDLYSVEIELKKGQEMLQNFFGEEVGNYNQSNMFEKQKFQEQVKKQKDELEIEYLKLNTEQKLFDQDKKIYENKKEAEEDRFHIRVEMQEGFLDLNNKIYRLTEDVTTFKGYVTEKFSYIENYVNKEMTRLANNIGRLEVEVKRELADTKVMFGKEIMRLDKQQINIVGKLQEYSNEVKSCIHKVSKIKLDAERNNMNAEVMLSRANNVYQHHKAELRILSKDLDIGMKKMALHDEAFTNRVGAAKLLMDKLSQDHYLALKDISYAQKDVGHGEIGINMLRKDYQQRVNVSQKEMQNLIQENRHIEENIKFAISRGQEVGALKHQLYMNQENLKYASHQNSMLSKENSMIRRLSK